MRNRNHNKVWAKYRGLPLHLGSPRYAMLPPAPEGLASLFDHPKCGGCGEEIHPVQSLGIAHVRGTVWHTACIPPAHMSKL